jgi:AbrB family looped-hinge helix DNA binding protein
MNSKLKIDLEVSKMVGYKYMELTQTSSKATAQKVGDYIGTVNTQGRVTLPEEVRKALGLHPQDKVVFRITEGSIELIGKLPTLEELAGSVTLAPEGQSVETVIAEAKTDHYHRRFTQKI